MWEVLVDLIWNSSATPNPEKEFDLILGKRLGFSGFSKLVPRFEDMMKKKQIHPC